MIYVDKLNFKLKSGRRRSDTIFSPVEHVFTWFFIWDKLNPRFNAGLRLFICYFKTYFSLKNRKKEFLFILFGLVFFQRKEKTERTFVKTMLYRLVWFLEY